ncbi:MAG: translocation/assembly module TamB domain-containing protein [Bacteroidaceae bacterium]|nr:translocation/assembly module TamB domain-containing protein [Bacteroidaceae bacterium]
MLVVIYTALMLLTSLPAFQRWGADAASQLLEEKLGSRVSISKLRLNMLGHVILDNVQLYDQRDTLMLQASRIAAKVNPIPLVEKRVRITGAQLIGAKVKLYKDGDAPCNFQFLVDAFSSKDTTSSPLNLRIGALVIRRGDVRFDRLEKPTTPERFNPDHLHVTDLNLTARVMAKMPDTLAIDLRGLSFHEESGFCLQRFTFEAKAGRQGATISDLLLQLPETTVHGQGTMESGQDATDEELPKSLANGRWKMDIDANICPRDLSCFIPQLGKFGDIVTLTSEAKLENGSLQLSGLSVGDKDGHASLLCDATVSNLRGIPSCFADIRELHTGPSIQQYLTQNLQGKAREVSPILTRLGSTQSAGSITYEGGHLLANLQTQSEQGIVSTGITLHDKHELQAVVTATDIRLGHLLNLSDKARDMAASLMAEVTGTLPGRDRQAKLSVDGLLSSLTFRGYEHRNIPFSANIDGDTYSGELAMDEPNGQAQLHLQTGKQQGRHSLQCRAEVTNLAPHYMNLTKRYEGERFNGTLEADFTDTDPNNLQGELHLTDMELASTEKGNLKVGDIDFTSNVAEDGMHLRLRSDFLRARADGYINWKTLPRSFMQLVRQNLPSLFPLADRHSEPSLAKAPSTGGMGNDFRFVILLQDTLIAERLLDTDLRLPEIGWLDGTISDAVGQIALQLRIPQLQTAGQQLQNITCRTEASNAALQTSLQFERIMKGKPVEFNLDAYAREDKVTSRLRWDNKRDVAHTGDISMTGLIRRDLSGQTAIDAKMNASRIVIGDTLWHIEPATIKYHDKVVDVEHLSISLANRHINIGGRLSDLPSDTLRAELADIDIAYIMDLANFHKVDFDGRATGSIYATSLLKKPFADAFLQVKDFTFNAASLGDMDLYANWGKRERAILLEADMRGPLPQHRTQVHGTIIPGKGAEDGLNLNIQTSHIDLSFLNKFTKKIFRDLQGRASGWARIFGPFKTVNLEGDMFINEMKMHVQALGTDYRLAGDSITLRPDNIWLRDAHIYDPVGMPGMNEHTASVNMHLMHEAFKHLSYDVNIDSQNLLCYNFPHQGNMSFYGTVYADAQVHLSGGLSATDIDVTITPMPETTIIYNVATPGTVSEAEFVTYRPTPKRGTDGSATDKASGEVTAALPVKEGMKPGTSSDLRINFDINANPNAQIRLLMDPRTGDNISLHGRGRLHANYYNKGRFQLYGTYRVSDGTYQMSIRDLIRKDFTFQPEGTIVFGGDAMQSALNLKATHTVPNVSLDDLSTTGLGLSNTRVDCIMHIGGIARDPSISFDFDIPNANEDEKQMVRSMLSSEEERDMQAIYLLGVGRFYTYGTLLDKSQTKGSMAMNSVLSSALSSRFNQIMSQALGGTGWSFGTNLRTGEEGWEHLDVEGLVSGKMLSGRLQFNGNFGYRENKYKMGKNNFIGDFDIQYRLSPRSPFSLKAYNQTNDRYFTQSSLTTQGIGIKFQRNFTRFLELFHRTKKRSTKE